MQFTDPDLLSALDRASPAELDKLAFGVIGMDAAGVVEHYNAWEARAARLDPAWVIGRNFFHEVGLCMNNFMVGHRYRSAERLDEILDYVLTFRMKPTPVRLRLLKGPEARLDWMAVDWS
ncbi:hypothetical protein [Roseospirillum parvum]|uniref:Photoactive yellow protein n=1 Tax=Roseospirillum parvum TaxID=83401 RepID=A0A1G8BK33_9PROT|nr:hypothetical protein [Roseospirillum parvum]SDH33559.1 photoactive yellow protein [Roseospirillum parvum]